MWDVEPVLYWRLRQNGKWTWKKCMAVQVQPGLFAIEMPVPKEVDESE